MTQAWRHTARTPGATSILDASAMPVLDNTGATDVHAALSAALAGGRPVILRPGTYRIDSPLVLPAGAILSGIKNPTIEYHGPTSGQRGAIESGGDGITLDGITIDARMRSRGITSWFAAIKVTHADVHLRDVHAKDSGWRGTYWLGATRCSWIGGSSRFHSGPGISLWHCSFCHFERIDLSDNANFGVHMEDATNNCHLEGLTAYNAGNGFTSLELVGMVFSCYRNKILNCFAEGTGDNGISVSGYRNIVSGNHCIGNTYAGIDVYGSENTVTGNYCANNNQRRLASHPKHADGDDINQKHAGIGIKAFWGGTGSRNTVTGNVCVDTQATPTQYIGAYINASAYPVWQENWDVNYLSYCFHAGHIYKARISGGTTGTTGTTPPTHTSGTVYPDGETVGWEWVTEQEGNAYPKHNNLSGNVTSGNIARQTYDGTPNANFVADEGLIQLKGPGTYNYRTTIETFVGHPDASGRTARIGSLVLRYNGGVGQNVYVKESGDLTQGGWQPLMTRRSGVTGDRPTPAADAAGYTYFDTTLGRPVWWTGAAWVDASGSSA